MRGMLRVFLETSAASAEWRAALAAVQAAGIPLSIERTAQKSASPQASAAQPPQEQLGGSDVKLLIDMFLQIGSVELAAATASLPPPCVSLSVASPALVREAEATSDLGLYLAAQRAVVQRVCSPAQTAHSSNSSSSDAPPESSLSSPPDWLAALCLVQCGTDVLLDTVKRHPGIMTQHAGQLERHYHQLARYLQPLFPGSEDAMAAVGTCLSLLDAQGKAASHPQAVGTAGGSSGERHGTAQRQSGKEATRYQDGAAERCIVRELALLHNSPKSGSTWSEALALVARLPHLTPDAVCLALAVLARQGREREAIALVREALLSSTESSTTGEKREEGPVAVAMSPSPPHLTPTPRILKAVTEAAHTMQSVELCECVLTCPALAAALAPSSAVPLVLTLHRARRSDLVLRWWHSLPPPPPPPPQAHESGKVVAAAGRAPLQGHLKLCNYIAVCYLSSSPSPSPSPSRPRWAVALSYLDHAKGRDPALATLFSLRLLRMARAWEPALRLTQDELLYPFQPGAVNEREDEGARDDKDGRGRALRGRRENWLRSRRAAMEVLQLFTSENPQQWVPSPQLDRVAGQVRSVVEGRVLTEQRGYRHQPRRKGRQQPW